MKFTAMLKEIEERNMQLSAALFTEIEKNDAVGFKTHFNHAVQSYPAADFINSRDENGNTLLIRAILKKNVEIVKLLLENQANINMANNDDNTPLMMACALSRPDLEENSLTILNMLCSQNLNYATKNKFGYNAIVFAIHNGTNKMLISLLEHIKKNVLSELERGAIINNQDKQANTPLMHATEYDHEPFVKTLLDYGPNIQLQNRAGNTALHLAVLNKNNGAALLLLDHGAMPLLKNHRDKSALQLALGKKNYSLYIDMKKFMHSLVEVYQLRQDNKPPKLIYCYKGWKPSFPYAEPEKCPSNQAASLPLTHTYRK